MADGSIGEQTVHITANDAIIRRDAWRKIGTKAEAYEVVVDTDLCKITHTPLK
jgi:hypothetical protein